MDGRYLCQCATVSIVVCGFYFSNSEKKSTLKVGGTKKVINKKPLVSVFDDRARKAELRQWEVEGMQGGGGGAVERWDRREKSNKKGFLSCSSSRTGIALK